MKIKTLLLLLLVFCLLPLSVLAQEWAPEGVELGGSRTPLPAPDGIIFDDFEPEEPTGLPEGYYIKDAGYDGQRFILVYREDGKGGREILFSVVQEEECAHGLQYVKGSYEQSGRRFLYFMLVSGKTLHGSLYCFSLRDNRMNLVLEEPCSNNMVLFENPPADIQGLGWVLYKDYILPIDLDEASSYEGMAASIEQLGGLNEIEGNFFAGKLTDKERKYTYLAAEEDSRLTLTTVVLEPDDPLTERRTVYVYDCIGMKIIGQGQAGKVY